MNTKSHPLDYNLQLSLFKPKQIKKGSIVFVNNPDSDEVEWYVNKKMFNTPLKIISNLKPYHSGDYYECKIIDGTNSGMRNIINKNHLIHHEDYKGEINVQ